MNPFPTEDPDLDAAIASAYSDLASAHADEDKHETIVEQLSQLYKLRNEQSKLNLELYVATHKHKLEEQEMNFEQELKTAPFFKRLSPDTVLTVAGNIFIGLAVIKYEQTGVISSQVRNFMQKI